MNPRTSLRLICLRFSPISEIFEELVYITLDSGRFIREDSEKRGNSAYTICPNYTSVVPVLNHIVHETIRQKCVLISAFFFQNKSLKIDIWGIGNC